MAADFSVPATLRPRRLKFVGLLVVSLVFVAGASFLLASPGASAATAWFGLVFFGACAVVFAVLLLPGASYLQIGHDGFTVCTLFRKQFYPWTSINRFTADRQFYRQVVALTFERDAPTPPMRQLNRNLVGYDGMLPDTYGMSATTLADLLNDALSRARLRTG